MHTSPAEGVSGSVRRRFAATGAVLVVDDDAAVRELVVEYLEEAGFDVIQAESAQEALERLAGVNEIRIVVSDIQMPGMSGIELAHAVSHRSDLKVILISGYFQPQAVPARFLRKPFRMGDLEAAIRAELGR